MPGESKGLLGGLFGGLKKRAEDAVSQHEAALVRGKVAGRTVRAPDNSVVVEAGHVVDDAAIQRAVQAGRLAAVMQAVVMAQAQDVKERATQAIEQTPAGREAKMVDSVDEYVGARRYVGRIAVIDVTDIRGRIVVPAGKEVTEDDVRHAREAGQLSALVYSAQQPQPSREARQRAQAKAQADAAAAEAADETAPKRATLPFVPPPPDSPKDQ